MKFFSGEEVVLPQGCGKLTMIRSKSGELMYLAEGSEKAVLMDTSIGVRGLRALVEELTDKPVTVLISHGHPDHAMGAPEFETAYMNHRDISPYRSMGDVKERMDYAELSIGPQAREIPKEDYLPLEPDYAFEELSDGMSFDLGGMHIDVYAFPGHTRGCMVFLLREARILITGDACNNSTFLFDENCSTVAEFRVQVEKIKDALEGKYDRVFVMHQVMEAAPDLLAQMLLVCDDVLNGKSDELPFTFMGKQAMVAKNRNEKCERADGGYANLVYNPERIR
ncbi:MAG: MBL fold metallo-hydrolase [Lachnospiraceae bacterium]|nr:MBL fold metallo-hydrolase [Lachnospiraceae bacterium]